MKKHLSCLLFLILITPLCNAQTYYGMTFEGGADSTGTIFSFNAATNQESVVYSFGHRPDGANPLGNLVYDSVNGLFYGMTDLGGDSSSGTIISFKPITNEEKVVYSFKGWPYDGSVPEGSMIYDKSKGLFYGMTTGGGTYTLNNGGTIFSFDPNTNTETMLWVLGEATGDGSVPMGNLVLDPDNGLLYGMTQYGGNKSVGGINGVGAIISFNTSTNKDSVVWNFGNTADGCFPQGSLLYDAHNKLFYGMTLSSVLNDSTFANSGVIFSFNPVNNTEKVLWTFGKSSDGYGPYGSFTYDSNNSLFYGMTYDGGANIKYGTIISFDTTGSSENVVYSFQNAPDANKPYADLIYDTGHALFYGLTTKGGANGISGGGALFSFNPSDNTESVVWSFGSGTDGNTPYGDLTIYPPSVGAGINQLTVESGQLTVYPNPTSDQVTVTSDRLPITEIDVINELGQTLLKVPMYGFKDEIDLSKYPGGVYFIAVINNSGRTVATVVKE